MGSGAAMVSKRSARQKSSLPEVLGKILRAQAAMHNWQTPCVYGAAFWRAKKMPEFLRGGSSALWECQGI